MALNCDPLKFIRGGSNEWKVKVRVIRLWNVYSELNPNEIVAIDMILADEFGTKIQASIRKGLFCKFHAVIKEGGVYEISNFFVGDNIGAYKLTSHDCRIYFVTNTSVTNVIGGNVSLYSLTLIPLSIVMAHEEDCDMMIDVIGLLTAISFSVISEYNLPDTKVAKLELKDEHCTIECFLHGDYVNQVEDFIAEGGLSEVILVIQIAKISMFNGKAVIQNFGEATRLLFNPDLLEVIDFKQRIICSGLVDANPYAVVINEVKASISEDFLSGHSRLTISKLLHYDEEGSCVLLGTISDIVCEGVVTHVLTVIPRYKIVVEVGDGVDCAHFVLHDSDMEYLSGITCADLITDPQCVESVRFGNYPSQLDSIVGRRMLFMLDMNMQNLLTYGGTFPVIRVCDDPDIISEFVSEANSFPTTKKVLPSICPSLLTGGRDDVPLVPDYSSSSIKEQELLLSPLSLASEVLDLDRSVLPLKRNLTEEFESVCYGSGMIGVVFKTPKVERD